MVAFRLLLGLLLLSAAAAVPLSAKKGSESDYLKVMELRFVGPFRGGRVKTVVGIESQALAYYTGATDGSAWKTANGGNSLDNVSDKDFGIGTIGVIAVSQSDPNIVDDGTSFS